jgi:hypothetical protein
VPWDHSALRAKLYFTPSVTAPLSSENFDRQAELVFWNAVKDSKSQIILQTYLDRFPSGTFAGLARAMIEQLAQEDSTRISLAQREEELKRAEQAKRAEEAARKTDEAKRSEEQRLASLKIANDALQTQAAIEQATKRATDLAQGIRRELSRVGCDPGTADAGWDATTREALREFVRITKLDVPTDSPTQEALLVLNAQRNRVCPLKCASGESEVNGRCVVKAAPPKERAPQAARQRPKSESGESGEGSSSGSQVGACPSLKGIARELRAITGC